MDRSEVITVFMVEDSPAIRAVLQQRLEEDPRFTVIGHADSAADAIAALSQRTPDVSVIDLHLKQGTGYDVLMYLRGVPGAPERQAIVLTNFASSAHRQRALALGASSFFDKSMQFDEMLDALRVWADEKQRNAGSASPPSD